CHCVDNPDIKSEMAMLRKYAPNVPEDVLRRLTVAFADLRRLVDEGLISYPYSTRELVGVAKHLQAYPTEGLSRALQNVFDFDHDSPDVRALIVDVLTRHGIPTGMESEFRVELAQVLPLPEMRVAERWSVEDGRYAAEKGVVFQAVVEEFKPRGGWGMQIPRRSTTLPRTEGRSRVFTEQLYTFTVPTAGEALHAVRAVDDTLYVVTSSPVTVHMVTGQRTAVALDLYEYFPLQSVTPQLKLAQVAPGKFCLYSALEHSLLILDFNAKLIYSMTIQDFEPDRPVVVSTSLADNGILATNLMHRNIPLWIPALDVARNDSPPVTQNHFAILDERLQNRGNMRGRLIGLIDNKDEALADGSDKR
ncbi:hypothetical protein BDK51DRAFT_25495, partial [Blyttiomyces helicus]